MLFCSYEFVFLFLPVVLAGYWLLGRAGRGQRALALWLAACSLFFYGWWNPPYLGLLVGSIVFNHLAVRWMASRQTRPGRKAVLTLGVTANLAALGVFKYFDFFSQNLGLLIGRPLPLYDIILPLGISFFTFQQVAFLVDTYRRGPIKGDFLRYGLFVSFFPQLIAGPIVYRDEMLPQLNRLARLRSGHLAVGLTLFFFGLFKKVVLADAIAAYSTPVFNAAAQGTDPSFFAAWQGALAYSAQIYFDFSGYTDMAIGLGRMFGLRLPLNFNTPYASVNIIDFWRRWHITLSRFLKDYLYIPLGGNRRGQAMRLVNIMLVMLIGGLWHGAGWTFVVWGGAHGFMLVINHLWHAARRKAGLEPGRFGFPGRLAATLVTMLGVVAAWVLFRAEDMASALAVLRGMAGLNGLDAPAQWANLEVIGPLLGWLGFGFGKVAHFAPNGLWLALGMLVLAGVGPNTQQILARYQPTVWEVDQPSGPWKRVFNWRLTPTYAVAGALMALWALMDMWKESEFIYFQF